MASRMDFKEFAKAFGLIFTISFVGLHILSLILSSWFPTFQTLVHRFSLAWMVIFLSLIAFTIFYMIWNIKTFDKKSIFIVLSAIALLLAISWYFRIDYGQLFDMSVVKNQLPNVIASIIP